MSIITDVIFRKKKRGQQEVVAIFPEIPTDITGGQCKGFIIGTGFISVIHSSLVLNSRSASENEYKETYAVLSSLGYSLNIITRATKNYKKIRLKKASQELEGIV